MSLIIIVDILTFCSTVACFLCSVYLLKVASELHNAGDSGRLVMSFGFIVFAYSVLKNTMPINEQMTANAVIMQEVFRILAPMAFSVLAIKLSKYVNKQFKPYHGIERRHEG